MRIIDAAMAAVLGGVLVLLGQWAYSMPNENAGGERALVACEDRCLYEIDIDAGTVLHKSEPLGDEIGTPVVLAWGSENRVFLGCMMGRFQLSYLSLVEIDTESLKVTRQIGPWTSPSGKQIEPGEIYEMRGFPAQNRLLVGCQGAYVLDRTKLLIDSVSGELVAQVPLGDYDWLDNGGNLLLGLQERGDTLIARIVDLGTGRRTIERDPDWASILEQFGPEPERAMSGLRPLRSDGDEVLWVPPGELESRSISLENLLGEQASLSVAEATVDRKGNRILAPVVMEGGAKGRVLILDAKDGSVLRDIEVGPYPTNVVLLGPAP